MDIQQAGITQVFPDAHLLSRNLLSDRLRQYLETLDCPGIINDWRERENQWRSLLNELQQCGLMGTIVRNAETTQWAFISPDPQQQGSYRYTCFDRIGFFAHGVYRSPQDTLKALFDMGYRFVDDSSRLDEVSRLPEWKAR
ncbi:hypothetical protein [Azomonas macrocytogenes]|uniref:Uncharacterized protein n=1 Tax=Azomonas macrocytogenes TaxID=69962 RepID=A0A839T8A1_AZOMA|nr:hypothetical protein [Azomonas macrocytogenes]MBB3105090.1 hypothetical protein [Azomonas macrocytogenes]